MQQNIKYIPTTLALIALLTLLTTLNMTALAASTNTCDGGFYHSVAIQGGQVWTWGDNTYGQLGNGTTISTLTPLQVPGLANIVDVSASQYHTLALRSDGKVFAFGNNEGGQLGTGLSGTGEEELSPVEITSLTNIATVVAGVDHSFAIDQDGTLWAWGNNYAGKLGDGTSSARVWPVVAALNEPIKSVAAGSNHTLGLTESGQLYVWGENLSGQLGLGQSTLTPQLLELGQNVISIAAGSDHSLAVLADGTVLAWGLNNHGQLGLGHNNNQLTPQVVPGLSNITQVVAGNHHSLAITAGGEVWGFGRNDLGQLANGTTTSVASPTRLTHLDNVTTFGMGAQHSLGFQADGTLWSWGFNSGGQLGNDTTTNSLEITNVNLVQHMPVSGVTLNHSQLFLEQDEVVQLQATIEPENATDQTLTWSSLKPEVVSVDNNGLITVHALGITTVTATSTDNPQAKDTCAVKVGVDVGGIVFGQADAYDPSTYPDQVVVKAYQSGVEVASKTGLAEQVFNFWLPGAGNYELTITCPGYSFVKYRLNINDVTSKFSVEETTLKPCDFNADSLIDNQDLDVLSNSLGLPPTDVNGSNAHDLNADSYLNALDLLQLIPTLQ